jgi:WD40 repeat protein
VAFSPQGQMLATGDGAGHIYLWNAATGQLIATLAAPSGKQVGSLAFSRGGQTLAAGDHDGNVYLWSLPGPLTAPGPLPSTTLADTDTKAVDSVAFSPSGDTLAAGCSNGHTYLWPVG